MIPTREQWLGALVDALRPTFAGLGSPLPEPIRVSCGWPSKSALSSKAKRIGEAWSARCSADGAHETFLSPSLGDAVEVGAVLVHELVHHAVGVEHGHRAPFARLAKAVGLVGPMRTTTAGPDLADRLHTLAERLGPYPHGALVAGMGRKKQTTRMLKVACADCGCIARMTRQWLDTVGAPTCACGGAMAEGGAR
ncbi:MAG: transcription elongation protein SprT [Planctomycetota bacterium]